MEVTGLVVGITALAGLCSTCLNAFSLIGIVKGFSIDYEILSIKLDFEKTRLLQWTEGIGLLATGSRERNASITSSSTRPQL